MAICYLLIIRIISISKFYELLLCIIYLVAILPDMERSSAPMADVILATNNGTIKHLSILKNRSPGYCRYITSRSVHLSVLFLRIIPMRVPPNTPTTVNIVSRFERRNCLTRSMTLVWDRSQSPAILGKLGKYNHQLIKGKLSTHIKIYLKIKLQTRIFVIFFRYSVF